MAARARQVIAPRFGGPEVLEVVDVDVPQAGPGQVTIDVRAAGVNPADYKRFAAGDDTALPVRPGFEVAGVLSAIGADTVLASGPAQVGDAVLAFRVAGGYASRVTVPAKDVFAKPEGLGFAEAANLLLAGATAADMLRVVDAAAGETLLVHGASGAVGVMVLQLARLRGVRVVGTASEGRFDVVRRFGGEPVGYGHGLEERVRAVAPRIDAALDCVGTDEAVDVSLALAPRPRIVTIANRERARRDGFRAVGGADPESAAFRDGVRADLVAAAARGDLVVPIAREYPLEQVAEALDVLRTGHPGGKLALLP